MAILNRERSFTDQVESARSHPRVRESSESPSTGPSSPARFDAARRRATIQRRLRQVAATARCNTTQLASFHAWRVPAVRFAVLNPDSSRASSKGWSRADLTANVKGLTFLRWDLYRNNSLSKRLLHRGHGFRLRVRAYRRVPPCDVISWRRLRGQPICNRRTRTTNRVITSRKLAWPSL